MRTVMVPTLCALVLALSACGGDDDPAATTPAEEKIEQTTPQAAATMKERDGEFVLTTDTKDNARAICKTFRDRGQTQAAGKSEFPIATDDGDYTCNLAKKPTK